MVAKAQVQEPGCRPLHKLCELKQGNQPPCTPQVRHGKLPAVRAERENHVMRLALNWGNGKCSRNGSHSHGSHRSSHPRTGSAIEAPGLFMRLFITRRALFSQFTQADCLPPLCRPLV